MERSVIRDKPVPAFRFAPCGLLDPLHPALALPRQPEEQQRAPGHQIFVPEPERLPPSVPAEIGPVGVDQCDPVPPAHHLRQPRSEEHTSELQSPCNLVCRLLLEKKKKKTNRKQSTKTKKKQKTA